MRISELFLSYENEIPEGPGTNATFQNSGMANIRKQLSYGFFPLGSGILTGDSEIDKASIAAGGVMVLGNDFGTITYLKTKCAGNRESETSKTISNLLTLGLSLGTTFFTNFYLGLRDDVSVPQTTMTKRIAPLQKSYKEMCFQFFKTQLHQVNPQTIICLGADVGNALAENCPQLEAFSQDKMSITKRFSGDGSENFVQCIDTSELGKRKFILIPHASYAHINWKQNNIPSKIKAALNS